MLVLADFVRPLRRSICLREKAFIERSGGLSFCVIPKGQDCGFDYLLKAYYSQESFEERDYFTTLQLPMQSDTCTLQSGLTDITLILSFLADQPAWLEKLQRSNVKASDETIVRSFGIDPAASCRPSVKAWSSREFLAPDEGGYAYFLVDTYGEVSVISRSSQLLPVAFHYAANREAEAVHLSSRIGKTAPAPDDDR